MPGMQGSTDRNITLFIRGFLDPFIELCKEMAAQEGLTFPQLAAELESQASNGKNCDATKPVNRLSELD